MDKVLELISPFSYIIIIICACYVVVFFAILSDLCSGIRKALKAGTYSGSFGLRETVGKLAKYYNVLVAVSLLDILSLLTVGSLQIQGMLKAIPLFPFFTMAVAGYLTFIEFTSVFESLEDKEKARVRKDMAKLDKLLKDKEKMQVIKDLLNKKP